MGRRPARPGRRGEPGPRDGRHPPPGRAVAIARIIAEAGVEITPETAGFASELRGDISRDLTAATAGQDRTVRIRVTTDADVAEAQIRGALARIGAVTNRLIEQTRARAKTLYTFIERQVIVKAANKIREWTQKTIQRVKLLLDPFFKYLKEKTDQFRRGWDAVRDAVGRAADGVAQRWRSAIDGLGAAFDSVRERAERAFRGLADLAEPHLARIRRGIEALRFPFDALRAYATGAFRVIGEQGSAAFRRLQSAADPALRAVERGFQRSQDTARSWGSAIARATTDAVSGLGRFRDGFRSADAAASAFSGRMGTLGGATRRAGSAFRTAGSAIGSVFGGAVRATTSVVGALGSVLGEAGSSVGRLGSSVASAGGKLTLFAGIAGAVTYAVGALGAGLAGLPALVGAAAASFAVFKLGMEGIKRAYESSLKPAIDQMKRQIEDTFQRTLEPAFKRLSDQLIPRITNEMQILAQSFADGAVEIIDMVNKGENIAKIEQLISNTAVEVRAQLVPALKNVVQAIIDIGANSNIMRDMVGIITDLTNKTADWLREMERTGEAERAVSALRSVMSHLEDAFFKVLTAATRFFTEATPGVNRLIDGIGDLLSTVDRLGPVFGAAAGAAGRLASAAARIIDSLPQGTLDAIRDSFDRLGDAFDRLGSNTGVQNLFKAIADQIPGLVDGITQFVDALGRVAEGIDQIRYGVAKADEYLEGLGLGFQTEAGKALIAARENRQAGDEIHEGVKQGVDGAKESLDTLPPKASEAGQGVEDGVKPPVERIPGVVDDATGQVSFQPVLDAANQVFGQLPTTVADGVNKSVDSMTQGTDKIRTSAETGFTAASDAATRSMTSMSQVVEERMQAAGQSAEVGGQRIGDGVRSGVQTAADTAQSGMARVGDAVRAAMDTAAQTAESGGRRIASAITDNVNRAADSAQSGMARVSESVRTGADQAAQGAQSGMDRVAQAVQSGLDRAASAAQSGGQRIADSLRSSTEQAAAGVEAGMNRVVSAVEQGMQRAETAAQDGGRRIEQGMRTNLDSVVRISEDSWGRIGQAFQQGGQRAVEISRAAGDQIVRTFQNEAGPMYDAGYTMISRLADGMIAAQGRAFAAAQSTAAGIRAMFPSSPAKAGPLSGAGDPLRSGGTIVERIAAGMTANAAAVTAALQPILSGLVARVNSVAANPMVDAAREILARIQSRGQMFEDLTWRGASANVGAYNDALMDAQDRSGIRDTRAFLEDYIRRNTPAAVAGSGGGDVAVLQQILATLIGMRGDMASSGYGPDMLDRLDRLIDAATSESAGNRTQRLRSVAALGAFG